MASGQPLSDIISSHFGIPSPGAVNDKIRSFFDKWYFGTGAPEGAITAPTGSLYIRDNGTTAIIYQKQSGSGNTGWAALITTGGGGGIDPATLTAKGSLLGASAASTPADVPVGADGTFLVADSTDAEGVGWRALLDADVPAAIARDAEVAAAYIAKTVADANSILYAVTDDTPAALAVAASRFVGRKAAGDVAAMTVAEAKTLLAIVAADVSDFNTAVATTAILQTLAAAKGDIFVATANDAPAVLTVGTNGQRLIADSSTASGLKWTDAEYPVGAAIDGGGVAITTGAKKAYVTVPFDGTIVKWRILPDQSGSIVIDVWKDTYANFPPTVADTITASDKPTLTTATKAEGTSLTGWTTSVSKGDVLEFNVDSVTTVTKVRLELFIKPR